MSFAPPLPSSPSPPPSIASVNRPEVTQPTGSSPSFPNRIDNRENHSHHHQAQSGNKLNDENNDTLLDSGALPPTHRGLGFRTPYSSGITPAQSSPSRSSIKHKSESTPSSSVSPHQGPSPSSHSLGFYSTKPSVHTSGSSVGDRDRHIQLNLARRAMSSTPTPESIYPRPDPSVALRPRVPDYEARIKTNSSQQYSQVQQPLQHLGTQQHLPVDHSLSHLQTEPVDPTNVLLDDFAHTMEKLNQERLIHEEEARRKEATLAQAMLDRGKDGWREYCKLKKFESGDRVTPQAMLEYIERYLIPKERDALDARKRSTSFAPSSTSYHPSSMSTGPPTDTASQHFSYMEIFIRPVVHLWKEQCEQTPSSISWMTPIETDGTPDDLKADGASTCYKRLNYVETQVVDASRNTKGSQAAASRYPERKQGYKSESFRDVFQRISSDSNDRSTSLDSFNNPPSKSNGSDTTTLSTSSLLPPRQRASREAKASPKSSNKAPRARKKSHLLKSTHRYDLDPGRQTRAKAHANAVGCSGTPLPRTPEVPSADDSYDDSDDGDVSSNNMIDIPEGNDRLSEAGEIQPSHSTTRIFEQPEYDIVQTQELTQPDNDETETDYMIESDNGSPRWRNAGRKVASAHGEDQNYSGSTKLAAHAKLEQAEMKRLAAEKRLQAHVATSATTSQERNYPKSRKKGITDKRTRTQGATRSSFHKDQAGSTGGDQTKKATLRHHSLAIESRNQSPWPTLSTPDPDVSSSKWHQIAGLEAQVDVVKFRMALILPYGQRIQDTVNYVRLADASSLYKSSLVKTKREEDDNNPLRNSPALTEIIKMDATKMSLDEKWIEWTEFGSDKDHHGPSPRLWACIVAAQRLVVPEAITPFSMKSSLSKKTTHRSATIVRAGDEVKYENDNENEARGENAERIPLVIDEFTQLEYAPKWLYNQFMHMLNRLRRLVEGDKLDQDFVLEALEAIRFEKDFVPFLKLFIPDNGASEPSRRDLKMAYRPEAKSTLTISEIQALKAVRRSAQAPGINLGDSQSGGGGGGGLGTTSMEAENPTDVFFELFGAKKDRDPSKAASVREMPPWARLAGSSSATQTSATSGPMDGFASQQQVLKRLPSPFEEREMEKDQNANRPWKRKA